jgi:hypothetical protein
VPIPGRRSAERITPVTLVESDGAEAPTSRGVATVSVEGLWARACPEPPSVQILVVVANTPEGSWRTDAEKGFM